MASRGAGAAIAAGTGAVVVVGGGAASGGFAEVLDALSKIATIAKWFLSLASASAVLPCAFSTSGEAPAESRNSTTSTCPLLAAAWSSV
jgi:hypothetical protein